MQLHHNVVHCVVKTLNHGYRIIPTCIHYSDTYNNYTPVLLITRTIITHRCTCESTSTTFAHAHKVTQYGSTITLYTCKIALHVRKELLRYTSTCMYYNYYHCLHTSQLLRYNKNTITITLTFYTSKESIIYTAARTLQR